MPDRVSPVGITRFFPIAAFGAKRLHFGMMNASQFILRGPGISEASFHSSDNTLGRFDNFRRFALTVSLAPRKWRPKLRQNI